MNKISILLLSDSVLLALILIFLTIMLVILVLMIRVILSDKTDTLFKRTKPTYIEKVSHRRRVFFAMKLESIRVKDNQQWGWSQSVMDLRSISN